MPWPSSHWHHGTSTPARLGRVGLVDNVGGLLRGRGCPVGSGDGRSEESGHAARATHVAAIRIEAGLQNLPGDSLMDSLDREIKNLKHLDIFEVVI